MKEGLVKKISVFLCVILLMTTNIIPIFAEGATMAPIESVENIEQAEKSVAEVDKSIENVDSTVETSSAEKSASETSSSSANESETSGAATSKAEAPAEKVLTTRTALASVTDKVILKVGELEGDSFVDNTKDYYSDETISSAVDLDVSGKDTVLSNAKLVIKVEKKFYITKPSFASSNNATSSVVTEDTDFYYATYTFDRLSGGQHVTIPLPFKFNPATAVKTGDQVKVSTALYTDGSDATVASDEKVYTAITSELRGEYHLYYKGYKYDWDTHTGYVKIPVDSTDATKMQDGYSIKLHQWPSVYVDRPADLTGNEGESKNTNFKIVLHLPKYAKLSANETNWKYVDDTQSSIYAIVKNNGSWPHNHKESNYKPSYIYGVDLIFSEAPFNEPVPITAEYWVDAGLESEYKIKDVVTSNYVFEPVAYNGTGGTSVIRDGDRNYKPDRELASWYSHSYYTNGQNIYYRNYDMTSTGMFYRNEVSNYNNGSGPTNPYGGVRTNVYQMKVTLREEGEYFTRVCLRDITSTTNNINLPAMQDALKNTPNTLYGIKEDGSKVVLAKNIKVGTYIDILDSSRQYKELNLVFDAPITLDNANLNFDTYTGLTKSELKKFDEGGSFYNGVKAYFSDLSVDLSEGKNPEEGKKTTRTYTNSYNYVNVSRLTPVVNEYIQSNLVAVYVTGGAPLEFKVGHKVAEATAMTTWGDITNHDSLKTITLLPEGIEYDGQSNPDWWKQFGIGEPTIVENYKGTGKTAVIVDYGNIAVYKDAGVTFKLRATKNTQRGDNDVVTYMVYDHNDIAKPYDNKFYYTDAMDLDNDGDLNETFMQVHTNINFIPALELILHKDGYFEDENLSGASVIGDMGSGFVYRVSVFNNAVISAKYVSLIDILPYQGDKVTVPNSQGEYKDRNSTFVTGLTGAIEDFSKNEKANSLFDFFYQTERKDTIEGNRDGVWLTKDQISDFSKVTGFKAVLKDGKEIASKEEVFIYLPSKIPYKASMNEEVDQSVNSAAFSTNGVEYNEGNPASVHFVTYEVKGTVYKDKNKDGLFTELNGDKKTGDESLENINVKLLNDDGSIAKLPDGKELITKTDRDGNYSFKLYTRGKYKVQVEGPKNYALIDKTNDPLISAGNSVTALDDEKSESAVFELNPQIRSSVQNAAYYRNSTLITVEKVWKSSETIPECVYFFLEKKEGDTWVNLNDTHNQGKPFELTKENTFKSTVDIAEDLTESDVRVTETSDDGTIKDHSDSIVLAEKSYAILYGGSKEDGFTITNTLTGKIEVSVTKKWVGKAADSVTIDLLADGKKIESSILTGGNGWKHTFENLEKYKDGNPIKYTIKEEKLDGYDTKITGSMQDGFTVTNTNTEKISVPVAKQWVGKTLDSVEVKLLADGKKVDAVRLTADNAWKHTFENLLKYDTKDGHQIEYTVSETSVDGYITGVSGDAENGFTITNTITGKVSVPVTKKWIGKVGDLAKIDLLADGQKVDTITLNDENNWQHTFLDLEKYDAGKEIQYTVEEEKLDGYDVVVAGNMQDGYTITNTNTEKISIPVTKQWAGKAADFAEIKLLADGTEVDSVRLEASNDWKHTFENLLKYDSKDGHQIDYTISETPVDGYVTGVSGDIENGFTITNTITGKVSVPVTKKWIGQVGDKITVRLYADGKEIDSKTITKSDAWQYTFLNLDQYKDGKGIVYTITEDQLPGYISNISGNAKDGFIITNKMNAKNKPSASNIKSPKTGDKSNILLYGSLMVVSLLLLSFIIIKRRRNVFENN